MSSQPPLLMSPSQQEMSATKRPDSAVRKLERPGSSQKNLLGSGLNVS